MLARDMSVETQAMNTPITETSAQNGHAIGLADETRPVLLCAIGDEQDRLAKMITHLNYQVVPSQECAAVPLLEGSPIAVVVSDSVSDPLGQCERFASICPVVLISDETDFSFRLATAKAGIAALIRRPVNPTEMCEWLAQLSEQKSTDVFSVLIVDDDWLTAEICAQVLRSAGVLVRTVNDPTLALGAIEEETPDLVLMDVQMPGVDGLELTRIIRQSRQFVSLPIVFLSAERDETRQIAARRIGGDDFINKPIAPDKLISLVRLRADRSKLLRSMIERDRLTGLYDATTFKERLSQELDRCSRTGAEVCLAMIDIDFFKKVNDQHGHLMGDNVLRMLSSSLVSNLRRIDIVGRLGGEEFGVVLLDSKPEAAASALDRIRKSFGQLCFGVGNKRFNVTFSAGVASSGQFGANVSELISSADAALYDCKQSGRNKVCVAT